MMITKFTARGLAAICAMLTSACTGPQVAQDVAGQMRKLTVEYEAAVSRKAEAERLFYKNQRRLLRDLRSGTTAVSDPGRTGVVVKKTVAYGRITSSALRDAILLADKLSTSPAPPPVPSSIIEFLGSGLENDSNVYLKASQHQLQLRIDLLDGLAKIEQQSQRLKAVRDELVKLETDPSLESSLKQFFVIGQAVKTQLAATNESDPPAELAAPN